MDLDCKLDELLAGVDMASELDRRRAYIRVIEYADDQVALEDYNLFLAKAADRLGQNRLMRDVLSMKLKADGKERIVIRFDEMEGCQIIANPSGCLYLSRAFRALSQAKLPGEHLHFFYGEPPLFAESYPAVLYNEDDAYLDSLVEDGGEATYEWPITPRNLDPEEIVGFFITEYIPENLMCTVNRIYPVLGWQWLKAGQDVWKKDIREDWSRMVVFTFRRDDGQQERVALDLDDEYVGFVTRDDLMQLLVRKES